MSRVFRARRIGTDVDLAVKVIRVENVAADYERRLRREPEVQRALGHENIIRMVDWFRVDDEFFLVLEFVAGRSLAEMIHGETGPLPFPRARTYARQILRAVAQLHELGIIHRDIKPSNVMIGWNDEVKLADFGIAKYRWEQGRTRTQAGLGTPEYMSPEQVRGTDIDQRTDIYSFGITLFEMLTARKPFTRGEETPAAYAEVVNGIMNDPLPDPRSFVPAIPGSVVRLLLRATAKDPDDRFQSVQELIGALEVVGDDLEETSAPTVTLGADARAAAPVNRTGGASGGQTMVGVAVPPASDVPRSERPRKGRRGGWVVWLLLILALASVGGYYGYRYYQEHYRQPAPGEPLTDADAEAIVNRVASDYERFASEQNPGALSLLYAPDSVAYFSMAHADREDVLADSRKFYQRIVSTRRLDVEVRRVAPVNDSTIDTQWIIYFERVRDDGTILSGSTGNAVRLQRFDNEWLITRQKSLFLNPRNVEPPVADSLEVHDIDTVPLRPAPVEPSSNDTTHLRRPPIVGPIRPTDTSARHNPVPEQSPSDSRPTDRQEP